ncbi:hypothetical protein V2J09_014837 [Rumex salicifolius]
MESPSSAFRRPCFAEEDDGLASIAEFSGAGGHHYSQNTRRYPIFSRIGGYSATLSTPMVPQRTGSLRNLASLSTAAFTSHCSSPRSGRIFDPRFEEISHSPHFLEACSLCKKPLGGNRDIFMYRGDTPFCSEECRNEQIEADEAMEKSLCLSASVKAMRKIQKKSISAQQNASSSPDKSQKYRAGTVAAA